MSNINLPMSDRSELLSQPISIGNTVIPNRIVIQPMEGGDSNPDGTPGERTKRRYERFAKSGAGLIWFEAVAVREDGRGNPGQLYITKENAEAFKALIASMKETAKRETGIEPVIIMQATHSGRYSRPHKVPAPIIAVNNPIFEGENPISKDRIITDEDLMQLEDRFAEATVLAQYAGFDGIDIKACHRYLNSELLSAHTREGIYGGSYENRTRFFKNCVSKARANAKGDFIVTSRMNIYDGFPYPYGFGVSADGSTEPDLTEAIKLISELHLPLINITMGNPYVNSNVNRPVDLAAVERMYTLTREIQKAFPDLPVISSAPTFLKERSGELAAGAIEQGYCKLVGFGRLSFAYPTFAKDIMNGQFDKSQSCVACGKCTELLRTGKGAGCVVRDKLYTDLYRKEV